LSYAFDSHIRFVYDINIANNGALAVEGCLMMFRRCLLVATGFLLLLLNAECVRAQGLVRKLSDTPYPATLAEEQIEQSLKKRGDFVFKNVSLRDALWSLSRRYSIPIDIDPIIAPTTLDALINCDLRKASLQQALETLLKPYLLGYVYQNETLQVTTQRRVGEVLPTRVYDVADLVVSDKVSASMAPRDETAMAEMVKLREMIFERNTLYHDGTGPGAVHPMIVGDRYVLVVSHDRKFHAELVKLLTFMREDKMAVSSLPVVAAHLSERELSQDKVRRALRLPVRAEIVETPLNTVVRKMNDELGVNIVFDEIALDDAGLASNCKVNCVFDRISLQAALATMLEPVELVAMIRGEVILITTYDRYEWLTPNDTRVYDVGDLVKNRDFSHLVGLCYQVIAPETWDEVGGPGTVATYSTQGKSMLIINHTDGIHSQVSQVLRNLRAVTPAEFE